MSNPILAADLFCGAGGTSTGLLDACRELGRDADLLAVNHWDKAIESHSANHPGVRHLCESLDSIDPRKVIAGGYLDLLWASPECTHHSNARGGKPCSDQSRATPWHVLRWCEALHVESVIIENVREFRNWGPLGANGRPLKSKRGQTFQAFLAALRSLNYTVEHRVLVAANYGDPTTRQRLFIVARRGRKRIEWPTPTHRSAIELKNLFGEAKPWRTAREIIDWNRKGKSIYSRKKPLSPNTMRRIEAGLRKFGGSAFIVPANFGDRKGQAPRCNSVDEPLRTVLGSNTHALVEPFLIHTCHAGGDRVHSLKEPIPTITGGHRGEMALIEPFLVHLRGTSSKQLDGSPRSVDSPLPALTGSGAHVCLIEPFLTDQTGSNESCCRSVNDPLATVATKQNVALIEPFLTKYYGSSEKCHGVDKPLDTITTKDRFGLVEPLRDGTRLDILFRMLEPGELAQGQGFPKGYKFAGNREAQVKQIGNAVPCGVAKALCLSVLALGPH